MKKSRAVVFTLSKDLAFSVACVMMDIKKLSPNLADEIVIIHDGISKNDQKLLASLLPTRFIVYDFPIKDTSTFHQGTLNYFTKMVFAKFECLKLLDDYKNVLLTDSDVVFQKDISELFEYCDSGFKIMLGGNNIGGQFHEPIDEYDMKKTGIATGIFMLQDHLRDYQKMYKFCYESLVRYANKLYLPEQAIFDIMLQEFNIQICPIDAKIYSPHPTDNENAKNAKIIHAYGQPKFWNGLENEQWNHNYKKWIDMGGSKYKKKSLYSRLYQKIKILIKKIEKLIQVNKDKNESNGK